MADQLPNFESKRADLAAGLTAVAESMRSCAEMAENFARIVADPSYIQEVAEFFHGQPAKGKGKPSLTEDKKRKRATKPKDPNAPKRPASSYILFQNEVRKELKEQNPEMSNSDLLGMISEQWKNMSDAQKEIYNQAMKTAKAQYSEEKKAYDNRTPEEVDAANAAVAAAASKKVPKPRGPKPAAAAPAVAPVPARPPPAATEASPGTDSSEDDDSEEEASPQQHQEPEESDESDEEEEPPALKKRRGTSAQPTTKSKKSSRA